jgi:hypothetical protein
LALVSARYPQPSRMMRTSGFGLGIPYRILHHGDTKNSQRRTVMPQFEFPCELRGRSSADFAVKSSALGGKSKDLNRKGREEKPQSTRRNSN